MVRGSSSGAKPCGPWLGAGGKGAAVQVQIQGTKKLKGLALEQGGHFAICKVFSLSSAIKGSLRTPRVTFRGNLLPKVDLDLEHIGAVGGEVCKGLWSVIQGVGVGDDLSEVNPAGGHQIDEVQEVLLEGIA